MRQFDCNNVYLDAAGRPLKGRVYFYVKNSTTIQNIYGSDGTTVLSNPMYTTNGRLAPQVFLKDSDYSIVWESYIGDGDMKTDNDSHSWKPAGSAISLQPSVTINIPSKGLVCAENITALRAIDPSLVTEGIVTLLGFNSVGDKPSINYVWDANCREADNGTSIIKPTSGTGAFVMVSAGDVDARHLGVFGAETTGATTSAQSLAIAAAHRYAVNNNCRVVFYGGAGGSIAFYRISAGSYTRFYCADNTARFVVPDDNQVTIEQPEDKEIYVVKATGFDGGTTLKGNNLRSSFNVSNNPYLMWNATGRYYIDTTDQGGCKAAFDGTTVVPEFVKSASKGYTFVNLNEIEGLKLPTTNYYTFRNCVVSDRLFASTTIDWTKITLENCVLNIENFVVVDNWISAVRKTGVNNLDFGGKSFASNVSITSVDDIVISNGIFAGTFQYSGSGRAKFVNCIFSAFASTSNQNNFDFVDCTVSSNAAIQANEIKAHNTYFSASIGSDTNPVETINADNSSFMGAAVHVEVPTLNTCSIRGTLHNYAVDGIVSFMIKNCTFADNGTVKGYHYMESADNESYCVKGYWIENVFGGSKSIEDDGNVSTSNNDAVYQNNVGNCFNNSRITSSAAAVIQKDSYKTSAASYAYDGIYISSDIPIRIFGYGTKTVTLSFNVSIQGTYTYEYDAGTSGTETRTRTVGNKFTYTTHATVSAKGEKESATSVSLNIYDKEFAKLNNLSVTITEVQQSVL